QIKPAGVVTGLLARAHGASAIGKAAGAHRAINRLASGAHAVKDAGALPAVLVPDLTRIAGITAGAAGECASRYGVVAMAERHKGSVKHNDTLVCGLFGACGQRCTAGAHPAWAERAIAKGN